MLDTHRTLKIYRVAFYGVRLVLQLDFWIKELLVYLIQQQQQLMQGVCFIVYRVPHID